MKCSYCGTKNRPDAPFCVECGEPLAVGNAAFASESYAAPLNKPRATGYATREEVAPATNWMTKLNPLNWSNEVKIGIAVVLAILLFDLTFQNQSISDAQRYKDGRAALEQKRWHAAAQDLHDLATKHYQQADKFYQAVQQNADAFDNAYRTARAADAGSQSWQAAHYYAEAQKIEPGYNNVDKELASIYQAEGKVVYRIPGGLRAGGLFSSEIDGNNLLHLPGSTDSSKVYAVAPDGSRIIYNATFSDYLSRDVLYDLNSRQFWTLGSSNDFGLETSRDGAMLNNGEGVILVYGGQLGVVNQQGDTTFAYYITDRPAPTPASVSLVARPNYADPRIYYVQAPTSGVAGVPTNQQVKAYDGQGETNLFSVDGEVLTMRVVGKAGNGPQSLLYTVLHNNVYSVRLTVLDDSQQTYTLAAYQLPSNAHPGPAVGPLVIVDQQGQHALITLAGPYPTYLTDLSSHQTAAWSGLSTDRVLTGGEFSPDGKSLLLVVSNANITWQLAPSGITNGTTVINPAGVTSTVTIVPDQIEVRNLDGTLKLPAQDFVEQAGFLADSIHFYYSSDVPLRRAAGSTFPPLRSVQGMTVVRSLAQSSEQRQLPSKPPTLGYPLVSLTADGNGLYYLRNDTLFVSAIGGAAEQQIAGQVDAYWVAKNGLLNQQH